MEPDLTSPSRRRVVQMGAVAGLGLVGAGTLAACGSDDTGVTTSAAAGGGETSTAAAGEQTSAAAAGAVLAKLSDIPVGQALAAKTADGTDIVLVQATAGEVTGFKAACTHQGCPVKPNGASLDCPCHGSKFGLDGAPTKGPAKNPLAAFAVKVDGEDVVAG